MGDAGLEREEGGAGRSGNGERVLTMVRWLLYLVFVVIGYFILHGLAPVLMPVAAAAGIAYLLDGAVDRLEARGVRRTLAVTLLLFIFLGAVSAFVFLVVPLISEEIAALVANLPSMLQSVSAWVSEQTGLDIGHSWGHGISEEIAKVLSLETISEAAGSIGYAAARAATVVLALVGFLAELLIIPVFAFYFLVDWDHMIARVGKLVPPRHRDSVGSIAREIDGVVSVWIRGQFIVTVVLGILYAVAFRFLGLPYGFTIGLIVGLLTIVPFLGTLVGAAMTAVILIASGPGWGIILGVAATFVLLHLLEAAVLTPKLVGKKVGLGEVGALFAVIAGGQLLGFVGVLLAVPLAASIAVLLRRAVDLYESSEFFERG